MQPFRPNPIVRDPLSEILESFSFDIRHFDFYKIDSSHCQNTTVGIHFKIAFVIQGKVEFIAGNHQFALCRGDVVLIPPFVRYSVNGFGSDDVVFGYTYFDFCEPGMETDFISLFDCSSPSFFPASLNDVQLDTFTLMLKNLDPQAPGAHLTAHILLEHLMLDMIRSRSLHSPELMVQTNDPCARLVRQCVDHLRQISPRDFSVQELCDFTHISQSYLYKCFRRALNCSPQRFLTLYRLKLAERELCSSTATIQHLAEQYGYTSAAAFTLAFKQYFSVSPAAWRRGQRSRTEEVD